MNKKITSFFISIIFILNSFSLVFAEETQKQQQQIEKNDQTLEIVGKSAILMEATTGKILYELNPDEKLSPASVTKVMTLLLIYEAIELGKIKWEDIVKVSEYAASMGGSQIFLEPMEEQTVETLTKSITIASANDAAVAMAEFIAGSEQEFVKMMNEKAKALGMENTNFENVCGLDTDTINHYMSAKDIAIVSRELTTKYPEIKKFTTTWQDTITHTTKKGTIEFGLTNTNKLLKLYDGATGLKTGSTSKALYCLSGTAERDGLSLIAVIMGAPDPKTRFGEVTKMFDYGFANYESIEFGKADKNIAEVQVYKGKKEFVEGVLKEDVNIILKKGADKNIVENINILENIKAPIEKGTKLGEAIYTHNNEEIARVDIVAKEEIKKASLNDMFRKLIVNWAI